MLAPLGIGGVPEGPSHEEQGLPVTNPETGETVAEMEGGERIFSVEDTQQMDQMVAGILTAIEQNPEEAEVMAAELGMFVVDAIMRQEEAQQEGEDMSGDPLGDPYAGVDPMMGGDPGMVPEEPPMFRSGGSLSFKKAFNKKETSMDRLGRFI